MFEPDAELAALLAADDVVRAELPEEEPPGWVLDSLPATELGEQQLFDRLVALDRQLARVAAEQLRVLAAIHQSDDSTPGWSQDAVSLALHLSGAAAQKKLKLAATWLATCPGRWPHCPTATSRPGTPNGSPKPPGEYFPTSPPTSRPSCWPGPAGP